MTAAVDCCWLPWHVSAGVPPFETSDCLGVSDVRKREHLGRAQTPGIGERLIPYLNKAIILYVCLDYYTEVYNL